MRGEKGGDGRGGLKKQRGAADGRLMAGGIAVQKKETNDRVWESGVLSIPNTLLEAAEIEERDDLMIETVPGVILIGKEDPIGIVNQPLFDLFQALGIERDEVERVLKG